MKFEEQIKKGVIEVINKDVLIIQNYPMGFKKCVMTFKKTYNRNGLIIERTSLFNGKTSKPKKTTATKYIVFFYHKELKRHFFLTKGEYTSISLYNTAFFNANDVFKEYGYSSVDEEYRNHPDNIKRHNDYLIVYEFFKDYFKGVDKNV